MIDPGVIYAAQKWPTNAHMIADVARMGYLRKDWLTLDPTYGLGNFWKLWQPEILYKSDIKPVPVPGFQYGVPQADFRDLEFKDGKFDAVVFDPPYKLNGTPTDWVDGRYGVGVSTRWQDRIELIVAGVKECARVVRGPANLQRGGFLLVKCMDQVVSGKVVWQTDIVTEAAKSVGMTKVDRLDFLTDPRPQPHTRQLHARRNYSSLLVFQK